MSRYSGLPPLQENVPLAPYTTLRVGGPTHYLVEATEEGHVPAAIDFARSCNQPLFILGGGSNIVVSDAGFPGLVIHIALRGIQIEEHKASTSVTAAAGEHWDPFVAWCIARNLAGIECLSGIPGTVGGTPIQNVGAYGQEAGSVIESVRVLDRNTLQFSVLANRECGFAYRSSIFNSSEPDRYIVMSVTFALHSGGRSRIQYPDLQRCFTGKIGHPSLEETREAVLKIRTAKGMVLAPDDPDCRSVGSFFKNPVVSEEVANRLEAEARALGKSTEGKSLPRYPLPGGMVKLSAAWLIERSGFHRGYRRGLAGISSKHTLAIINRGGAGSRDIVHLMHEVQSGVMAEFGINLVPEPVFVGF